MLQEYRNYIINIRNSLIQCGVDVPVSPLSSYREIFYEADKLRQVLWFYRVLAVSGSPLALEGFLFDLKGYYKEKMRQQFFSEFGDYYNSYKNISSLAFRAGETGTIASDDTESEFDLFEEIPDIHGTYIDDVEIFESEAGSKALDVVEEVHGTYIDIENIYENIDKVLGTGYIPAEIGVNLYQQVEEVDRHGTFLDDVQIVEGISTGDVHGIILDDMDEVEDVRGTILDDVIGDGVSDDNYDGYDDIHYSEDEEDSEEEVYDDIHYSDDEEYDEEVYDDIHYSDDEEEYDDIHYSDDEEDEVYDDIHYSDDEDDAAYIETGVTVKKPVVAAPKPVEVSDDLSDYLQDKVNDLLTKGKRFIVTESRKLRNGDKN